MIRKRARIGRIAREGASVFFRKHGMVYSASVAFNLLLSVIPILFLVFGVTSFFLGTRDLPFDRLKEFLNNAFPYGSQVLVTTLKGLFASRAAIGILGVLLLILSSFSFTDAVHTSLAVMMGTGMKKRFLSLAKTHVALVLSLTVVTFTVILVPYLWSGISAITRGISVGLDAAFHLLLTLISDIILAGVIFAGGAISYRYLSPIKVRWENALAGSSLLLVLLYGIRWGFTFYLKKISRLNIIYGSLFGIICFIIASYLFAAAYLFGASIIGVLEREEEGYSPEGETGAATDETPGGD